MSHYVALPRLGTFPAWRDAARQLAGAGVSADQVIWSMAGAPKSLFEADGDAMPTTASRNITVPKDFPGLAKQLCASRISGAFDVAYQLLIRCVDQPHVLNNRSDPLNKTAQDIAKNIRRDMHKMKAFVRFREVTPEGAARRQFVSWFEPDHRIEELIAGFFTRRFADMDWMIITPEVTTKFADGNLTQVAEVNERLELSDTTEELWRTYYANIFNPARLKIKAMQSEMPKKYWKNLPEATLIPGLIAQAEARVLAMRDATPSLPPMRAERILDALPDRAATMDDLHNCARCPLAGPATQVVPGDGPKDAALMIVGEQPGDLEDLAGRPFVGPAGQAFDAIAAQVGLNRHAAYVTNAVKHFKFQPRGKRRIHQRPNTSEVSHCRFWLDGEIAEVQPRLILALGATAALALTGNGKDITKRQGTVEMGCAGVPVFLTTHPAFLLRQTSDAGRDAAEQRFRADLAQVAAIMDSDGTDRQVAR